jgi:hypothetical protein
VPTIEALTCVNFQYGIVNEVGVTADEIFNEVNNTLRTGLWIATRNVTIEIINATFPRDEPTRQLRKGSKSAIFAPDNEREIDSGNIQTDGGIVYRLPSLPFSEMILDNRMGSWNYGVDDPQRHLAYLNWQENTAGDSDGRRRLVFYTDEFQPVISIIIDNPFCDKPTPETECAIVVASTCVVLEEGDDETEVRTVLLEGLEEAILNGEFEDAIPLENRLPEP